MTIKKARLPNVYKKYFQVRFWRDADGQNRNVKTIS